MVVNFAIRVRSLPKLMSHTWREVVPRFLENDDAVCRRVICGREPREELPVVFVRKAKTTRRLTPLYLRQSRTRIGKICHPHTPRILTTNFPLHLSRRIAYGCEFRYRGSTLACICDFKRKSDQSLFRPSIRFKTATRVGTSIENQRSITLSKSVSACDRFGQRLTPSHSQNANGQFSIFSKSLPDSWLQISQPGFDPRRLHFTFW